MNNNEYEITTEDIFDYKADDKDLATSLNRRIKASKDFFDKDERYLLTDTRKQNDKLWRGKQTNPSDQYDYELVGGKPYSDPRVFISTEAVISYTTAVVAHPETYPGGNTETSTQLAEDIGNVAEAYVRDNYVMEKAKVSVRHLLNKRIGLFKWYWDPDVGENGEIICKPVNPDKVIFDHASDLWDNPGFIAEEMEDTVSDLLTKYPESKKELTAALGWSRLSNVRMDFRVKYYEVHFTDSKTKEEVVCWLYKQVVFGKMLDPNWDEKGKNFLDQPSKPYIVLNWINSGEHIIDDTTPTEMAESLQHMTDKRGRQINDSADRANPTKVFSAEAMDANNAAQLTGAPDEAVILKKGSVRDGFTYVQAPPLSQQIFEDRQDMRQEIDNVFATPNTLRGEQTHGDVTLGEIKLINSGATGRLDDLVRAIDSFMTRNYRFLLQMMKIYYTEEHYYHVTGDDGEYDYIGMQGKNIEKGLRITVTAGSSVLPDKTQMQNIGLGLAKMALIDPLSLYEVLQGQQLPSPRKMVERFMTFRTNPVGYLGLTEKETFDRKAFADLQILLAGKMPDPPREVTLDYMAYFRKYMMGGEYRDAKPPIKSAIAQHVQLANDMMQQQLSLEQTQAPMPPGSPGEPGAAPTGAMPPDMAGGGTPPEGAPAPDQMEPNESVALASMYKAALEAGRTETAAKIEDKLGFSNVTADAQAKVDEADAAEKPPIDGGDATGGVPTPAPPVAPPPPEMPPGAVAAAQSAGAPGPGAV